MHEAADRPETLSLEQKYSEHLHMHTRVKECSCLVRAEEEDMTYISLLPFHASNSSTATELANHLTFSGSAFRPHYTAIVPHNLIIGRWPWPWAHLGLDWLFSSSSLARTPPMPTISPQGTMQRLALTLSASCVWSFREEEQRDREGFFCAVINWPLFWFLYSFYSQGYRTSREIVSTY
jgi:hypothetical protein